MIRDRAVGVAVVDPLPLDDFARDDEDTALLTWSALPDPGLQVSIHSVLHLVTISASDELFGQVRIVFQATDVQGATATDTLLINIHRVAPNTAASDTTDTTAGKIVLTIAAIPALSFHSGNTETIALDRYAQYDGRLSALTWTTTPNQDAIVTVAIDSTRTATVTALVDSGSGSILFRVEDPEGLSALAEVPVEILPELTDPEPGDFDRDGRISFADFFRFVEALGLTTFHPDWDPTFDLNDDGQITLDDFFRFVDAFAASNAQN